MPKTAPSAPKRLIGLTETCERTGHSRWTLNRMVAEGRFPRPVRVGRRTMFEAGEVAEYIDRLLATRDEEVARC